MTKQYELWWARLPTPAGRRPVLLLSRDGSDRYLAHLLAAEITTHVRGLRQEVLLGPRDGMPRRCVANFDNLVSVPRSYLTSRITRLSEGRVDEVKRALGHALMWTELTRL